MIIDKKSFELLEFEKVLTECMECCYGEESARLLKDQPFLSSVSEWERRLSFVKQFYAIYEVAKNPSLFFPSIYSLFSRLKPLGAVADSVLLYQAARFFQSLSEWRKFFIETIEANFFDEEESFPFMKELPSSIPFPYEEVLKTFDSEGQMLETHEDMQQLRRERSEVNRQLKSLSSSLLSSQKEIWQEDQPVFRNGRLLLPLKSNYKGRVKGVIHELSASANTLFIEPFELMEINNRLVELETRSKEIQLKWMRFFSSHFHDHLDLLQSIYEKTLLMDSYSARALYAKKYHCHPAQWGNSLELPQAVHPALGAKAVPVEIRFTESMDLVVISGANAGGKTVLLKTIALAVMMNQFGMFVHAKEGAILPLFTRLVCAMGDNQSIDEGVSTFSGYMKRVAQIFEWVDSRSLVMLDELGSGTDPVEGAVLGVAILEKLQQAGCKTFVTTHHQEIRNYAQTSEGAINLAVLFDEETQLPSYQIQMGFAGQSRAIDIAAKSGLPPSLIANARRLLKAGKGEELTLMEKLAQKEEQLKTQSEALSLKDQQLQQQYRSQELKTLHLKQKELELKREKQAEISLFVKATKKQLESLVSDLNRLKKEVTKMIDFPQPFLTQQKQEKGNSKAKVLLDLDEANRQVDQFWSQVEKATQQKELYLEQLSDEIVKSRSFSFQEGMNVLVAPHQRGGVLLQKGKRGMWIVQVGQVKMTLHETQLTPCEEPSNPPKKRKKASKQVEFVVDFTPQRAELVLDVRGFTFAQMQEALAQQIERALLNRLQQFSIIHGLGEGVLQKGVHQTLKQYGCVKEFSFAAPERGGFGRTEVVLDI